MRNRLVILSMTVLLAVFLAAGCASTRQLSKGEMDQFDAISAKIAKAEKMGARECAPVELGYALAERDYAHHEATEPWETASKHIGAADKDADVLLAKTTSCWEAKQAKMAPPPPPTTPPPAPSATPSAGACRLDCGGPQIRLRGELHYASLVYTERRLGDDRPGYRECGP
jgi:hypothetical protein